MGIETAIIGGSALSAGANIIGASVGGEAQRQAARDAANINAQAQGENRKFVSEQLQPYQQAGQVGLTSLQNQNFYQAPTNAQIQQNLDPSMQFRLDIANQQQQGSAAARGGLYAGGTGQALAAFNQGFASTEYNNAFERYLKGNKQAYDQSHGTAEIGANATARAISGITAANNSQSVSGQNAAIQQGAATAQQAATISNAVSGVGTSVGQGVTAGKYFDIFKANPGLLAGTGGIN